MKQYLWNLLILLDEFGNTLTGGDPGETISSRAGKAMNEGRAWGCFLCRFLDIFQKNHCQLSIDSADGKRAVIKD